MGFRQDKEGYLQGQIGNPDGDDKPNKKFYDPRVWVRKVRHFPFENSTYVVEDKLQLLKSYTALQGRFTVFKYDCRIPPSLRITVVITRTAGLFSCGVPPKHGCCSDGVRCKMLRCKRAGRRYPPT